MSEVQEKIQIVREVVQKKPVQITMSVIGALLLGVVIGRSSMPECKRDVICKDLIKDNGRLSKILVNKDVSCTKEKSKLAMKIKKEMSKTCDSKIEESLKECEFSERLHCPICIAKGACKK
tara:strand:- start:33 stop:395 length:363 start_codon:yes stop_codon:yes gene_type:complete